MNAAAQVPPVAARFPPVAALVRAWPPAGLRVSAPLLARPNTGSVLILAVWALFFLGALAVAVGSYVSANLSLAGGLSKDLVGTHLARAGIEMAIAEVACDTNGWDGFTESWADRKMLETVRLPSGEFSVSHTVVSEFDGISTNFGLIDEESKVNITRARPAVIEALIKVVSDEHGSDAKSISECIVDWSDTNNKVLTDGAESSYYEALSDPYPCHNGDFDSIDELLLVKGMTQELLEKLRPHVTVFGMGFVNINTASRAVLMALAQAGSQAHDKGAQHSVVERLLRYRKSGGTFESRADVSDWRSAEGLSSLESAVFGAMARDLDVRSSCFGGEATGWSGERRGPGTRIAFVYDRRLQAKVYWYEF